MLKTDKHLDEAVEKFLFDYRNTEHYSTGRSPAWMIYKRELRTKFDLLRPNVLDTIIDAQLKQALSRKASRKVTFLEGEKVWANDYTSKSNKRVPGDH